MFNVGSPQKRAPLRRHRFRTSYELFLSVKKHGAPAIASLSKEDIIEALQFLDPGQGNFLLNAIENKEERTALIKEVNSELT